jgi:hypothetical protein
MPIKITCLEGVTRLVTEVGVKLRSSNAEAWAAAQKAFHAYGCLEQIGIVNTEAWTAGEGNYYT